MYLIDFYNKRTSQFNLCKTWQARTVNLSFDSFSSRRTLLYVQLELESECRSAIMLKSLFGRIAVPQNEFLLGKQSTKNLNFYWTTSPSGTVEGCICLTCPEI